MLHRFGGMLSETFKALFSGRSLQVKMKKFLELFGWPNGKPDINKGSVF